MLTMAQTIRQFWKDLNELVDPGLPLIKSLNLVLSDLGDNGFASDLEAIIGYITSNPNTSFSEALAKYPRFFGKVEMNLIRAGEMGGMLEVVIARLARGSAPTKAEEYKNLYSCLSTCLTSGVPVQASIRLAKDYCTGDLAEAVEQIYESIKSGDTFEGPMKKSGLFCNSEVDLVEFGGDSGCLDSILLRLAQAC